MLSGALWLQHKMGYLMENINFIKPGQSSFDHSVHFVVKKEIDILYLLLVLTLSQLLTIDIANSFDPDQIPNNLASDQDHMFLT